MFSFNKALLVCFLSLLANSFCFASEKLVVITELSPPLQTIEQGQVQGSTTKVVRELLAEAGIDYQIQLYPWARGYNLANNTPNSLIYAMAPSEERKKHFEFLLPVVELSMAFISVEPLPKEPKSLADVMKYSVAVQRDDIMHNWLLEKGYREGRDFFVCANILCSWELLLNRKVDMVVEDPALALQMLEHRGLPEQQLFINYRLPEMSFTGYLAANKKISPMILAKLRAALTRDNK